jgi:hypothetical protein
MGKYSAGRDKPDEIHSTKRYQNSKATGRFERDPGTVPKGDPSTLPPPGFLTRGQHIALRQPVTDARHVRQGRAAAAKEQHETTRAATDAATLPVFSNPDVHPDPVAAAAMRPFPLAPAPTASFLSSPDASAVMPARTPNPRTHSMLPSFITPPSALQTIPAPRPAPSVKPMSPMFLAPSMPISSQFKGSK